MALKATIFRATLQIADLDRHYYHDHNLTLARHPSETDTRMMVRLLAFCLHAHPALVFSKGLSTDDEPDLWQKDPAGSIEGWFELGQPDEKRLRKACGRARKVVIYCYSGSSATIWWSQVQQKLARFDNLSVINLDDEKVAALQQLVQRNMQLHCTIQDARVCLGDATQTVELEPEHWK